MTPSRLRAQFRTVLGLLAVLALLAWAPWLGRDQAKDRAEAAFAASWEGVIDGCGLHCEGCGTVEVRKILFGYQVELEYACGMIPADTPEYHERSMGFVSFLGTVHGFPGP